MAGTLYLVGTPIGNLNDLSPRAIETLKNVDFIAAEDTRVTLKLLNHFGIRRPLISYYEHNKVESAAVILPRLLGGESCALVSDAGMPAISDPGEELVRLCGEHGITVSAAPGPSAVITALAMSGLPTQRFTFEGFLSTSNKSRKEHLETLRHEHRTIVLYEAPQRSAIFTMCSATGTLLSGASSQSCTRRSSARRSAQRSKNTVPSGLAGNLFSSSAARRSKRGRASRLRMRSRSWRNTAPEA